MKLCSRQAAKPQRGSRPLRVLAPSREARISSHAKRRFWSLLAVGLCAATALACIDVPEPAPVPANKPASYPAWWFTRGVIERTNPGNPNPVWPQDYPASDDFATLTAGQLKNLTTQAYLELLEKFPNQPWDTPGTPANALQELVFSWHDVTVFPAPPLATGTAHHVVNQGTLKQCAKRVYDVLATLNYTAGQGLPPSGWTSGPYPWTAATPAPSHYSAANLGMAKYLFSIDLQSLETDQDGMPDPWEMNIVNADPYDEIDSIADVTPEENLDGDSLTNFDEWELGLDPLDGSDAPGRLEIVSGNEQTADGGQQTSSPLVVKVSDYLDRPMVGAPIHAWVEGGLIRVSGGTFATTLDATTDSQGQIAVECKTSADGGEASRVVFETSFSEPLEGLFYTAGWLGLWNFDEGADTLAHDRSGFQRDAILNGTTWVAGKLNSALRFTPSSRSVAAIEDSASSLDLGGGSFTVMAWVKSSQTDQIRVFGQGFYGDQPGFALDLGFGGAGRFSAAIGTIGGANLRLTTTQTFNDGQWHHVALVVNRSAGTVGILVDGTRRTVQLGDPPAGSAVTAPAISASAKPGTGEPLIFGWELGAADYLDGDLDEARLYRGALTDTEIAAYSASPTNSDSDEFPDSWEQQIVDADAGDDITDVTDVLAGDDFDGDGLSNLNEFQAGTSPIDFFNGNEPFVVITKGDKQSGTSGNLLDNPVYLRVEDQYGRLLDNAPLFVEPEDEEARVGTNSISLSGNMTFRSGISTKIYIEP